MQRLKGSSTVLVIDDEPEARELLQSLLRENGLRVISAANGNQGLRLARAMQPDAITLDPLMPDVDGRTVLAKLQDDAELSAIPVIVFSRAEGTMDREEMMREVRDLVINCLRAGKSQTVDSSSEPKRPGLDLLSKF
jgi:CheY-like chemotaxis protein